MSTKKSAIAVVFVALILALALLPSRKGGKKVDEAPPTPAPTPAVERPPEPEPPKVVEDRVPPPVREEQPIGLLIGVRELGVAKSG